MAITLEKERPFLLRNLFGKLCPVGEGVCVWLASSLLTGALQNSPLLGRTKYSLALKIIATKKKKMSSYCARNPAEPDLQDRRSVLRQPGSRLSPMYLHGEDQIWG